MLIIADPQKSRDNGAARNFAILCHRYCAVKSPCGSPIQCYGFRGTRAGSTLSV